MNDSPLSRSLISIAAVFIIIAGLKVAQTIVVPVFVAIFLAVIISPAVSFLVRIKIPRGFSITIVVMCLFGFFYGLGTLLATSTDEFLSNLPTYQEHIQSWLVKIENKSPWLVDHAKSQLNTNQPTEQAISMLGAVFSSVGSLLTTLVLIVFTLIFTLLEAQNTPRKARIMLGDDRSITYVKRFSVLVQKYLLIKSLVSLVTGIFVGVLLYLVGIDYPVLWGTLAFLMNFIPNIGSLLAAIPPILLGSIEFGLTGFLITTFGFVSINTVIGNLVEPRLMGKTLDLSPLIVFLSLIFWGWILGPVGMLLSIPLTVVVKIALEVYPPTKWIAEVISQ